MQRIDECGSEGADAVIGEIAPQYYQLMNIRMVKR